MAWNGETIDELRGALARRATTSEQFTERCLDRIAALNPRLNAFITVTADAALAAARAADRARARGDAVGPLHGIPISIKDLIDQAGLPNTAGSRVRRDVVATTDAPVTARVKRAGAVMVGRTNLHEFAFGTTTEDSGFGLARHPVDDTRSPGGSSGGSGIAVKTGMSIASIGTDTGGSIRIPAAACGVVGLKPGWGEIPTDGVVPLSRQLDHVGPLARTVTDAWLLHEVLAGRAPAGRRAAHAGRADRRARRPARRLLLGSHGARGRGRGPRRRRGAAARRARSSSRCRCRTPPTWRPSTCTWCSATPRRITPRRSTAGPGDYTTERAAAPRDGPLRAGRGLRPGDARPRGDRPRDRPGARRPGRAACVRRCRSPRRQSAPRTVPVRGGDEPVRNAMLRLTQPFNLGRQPAVSLPCGVTPQGLPVGLQLVGPFGHTLQLLQFAAAVERVLPA